MNIVLWSIGKMGTKRKWKQHQSFFYILNPNNVVLPAIVHSLHQLVVLFRFVLWFIHTQKTAWQRDCYFSCSFLLGDSRQDGICNQLTAFCQGHQLNKLMIFSVLNYSVISINVSYKGRKCWQILGTLKMWFTRK